MGNAATIAQNVLESIQSAWKFIEGHYSQPKNYLHTYAFVCISQNKFNRTLNSRLFSRYVLVVKHVTDTFDQHMEIT